MKLKYGRFKYLLKERLALNIIQEAEDAKGSSKKKESMKKVKSGWESLGNSFVCPRHGLPLETHWQYIKKNEVDLGSAERADVLRSYNQILPSTSKMQQDNTLKILIKGALITKRIPRHFYCPLTQQKANESTEDREFRPFVDEEGNDLTQEFEEVKKKLGEEVKKSGMTEPDRSKLSAEGKKLLDRYVRLKNFKAATLNKDAYPFWVAERDEKGNVIKDEKNVTKMKKVSAQCDYIVGGRWQKPGQISHTTWINEFTEEPSSYRAFGIVAQEEEAAGNLKRSSPKRSKAFIEKALENTRPETAPDALVSKIYDMAKKGYRYAYVRQDEAAEKVYEFIKKNNVTGITGIGFSDDGKSIEVVLAVPFETIEQRAKKEPDNKKLNSLYNKLKALKLIRAGGVPITFSDDKKSGHKKLLNIQDIKDGSKDFSQEVKKMYSNIAAARKHGSKGQLTKVELERTPDGKPIFTSRDAWFLAAVWPQKLRDMKDKAGENYAGPKPYMGVTTAAITQLLRNMGWEQASSKKYDVSTDTDAQAPDDEEITSKWSGAGFRPKEHSKAAEKENKPTWVSSTSPVMDFGVASEESLQARIDRAYAELSDAENAEEESLVGPKQFPEAPGELNAIKKRTAAAREKLNMLLSLKDEEELSDIAYATRGVEDAKKLLRIARASGRKEDINNALSKLEKAQRELDDYKELERSAQLRQNLGSDEDDVVDVDDKDDAESDESGNVDDFLNDLGDEETDEKK